MDTPELPTAGWHSDPAGSGRQRWWNGVDWSDTFRDVAAPATSPYTAAPQAYPAAPQAYPAAPQAYPAAPQAYPAAPQAYPMQQPYNGTRPLLAAPGTSPSTPFIWIIAALPLAGTVWSLLAAAIMVSNVDIASTSNTIASVAAGIAVWLVPLVATIVLAYVDARTLLRRGVQKPFPWAWSFFSIIGVPVYLFGRSIVARMRTGAGLAPLFVYLALWAFSFVLHLVIGV